MYEVNEQVSTSHEKFPKNEYTGAILKKVMKKMLVRAQIHGIALEQESQLPIVLLKTKCPEGILPMPVGPAEASSIIVEIEGVHPPRPLPHDLIADIFRRHRFVMEYCEIREHLDDFFTAYIHYRRGFRKFSMEVRPSDGIAMSLKLETPIMVNPELLARGESDAEVFSYLHGEDILLLEPSHLKNEAV